MSNAAATTARPGRGRRTGAGSPAELPDYPQVSGLVLGLLAFYIFASYIQLSYRFGVLAAIRFEFLLAAALSVFAVMRILNQWGRRRGIYPLYAYVAIFFFLMLIQVPLSSDVDKSWRVFNDRVVQFSFIAVFIANFVQSPKHLRVFLGAWMLACMKLGQEGMLGKITGGLIWQNQGIMRLHGPTPLYFHPNSFAGNALGTIPFVLYLFPVVGKIARMVLVVQVVFAANIVLYTGSRTGYVAIGVMAAYMIYRAKSRGKALIVLALVVLVLLPLIPGDYLERAKSIFTGEDKEGQSTDTRIRILKDAWAIFLDHPLGVGVRGFQKVRWQTFARHQDTHNLYLEVATNLGIQGLIFFLLFIYELMRVLIRIRRALEGQVERLGGNLEAGGESLRKHVGELKLMAAACTALELFLVIRLALGMFGMDLYEIYWWFTLGLTVSLFNMNEVARRRTLWFEERLAPATPEPVPPLKGGRRLRR